MSHLPADRLAALADEAPSAAEAAHLAECAECARERDSYRCLLRLAAQEIEDERPPLTDWNALSGRLHDEGLLTSTAGAVARTTRSRRRRGWIGAAAAVMLLAGGISLGWYFGAASQPQSTVASGPAADASRPAGSVLASDTGAPRFRSAAEAVAALQSAEREYQAAAAFLAEMDGAPDAVESTDVYRTRLAALDQVAAVTREALYEAPHDPLINRYYLATQGAREVTLRQLGTALPAGRQINRY